MSAMPRRHVAAPQPSRRHGVILVQIEGHSAWQDNTRLGNPGTISLMMPPRVCRHVALPLPQAWFLRGILSYYLVMAVSYAVRFLGESVPCSTLLHGEKGY